MTAIEELRKVYVEALKAHIIEHGLMTGEMDSGLLAVARYSAQRQMKLSDPDSDAFTVLWTDAHEPAASGSPGEPA